MKLKLTNLCLLFFVLAFSVNFIGCGTESSDEELIGDSYESLYGDPNYTSDCSTGEKAFLDKILKYGRISSASDAFAECVDEASRNGINMIGYNNGPYLKCNNDPYYNNNINSQIDLVLNVAQSMNDLKIHCSGGAGNASTYIGSYGHGNNEEFWWGGWFDSVYSKLNRPLCSSNGNVQPCRYAAAPWPYTQASGIIWHEVMHTHGYTHGANDQANAKNSCGYSTFTDAQWHFQRNTMPYIIGNCIDNVITRSGTVCGNVESGCGKNELRVITGVNSNTCECVHDPKTEGLGLMSFESNELTDEEMVAKGDWMGGWHYGNGNKIVGSGDFDGDGKQEFLIKSNWGLGLVGQGSNGRLTLLSSRTTNSWMGYWRLGLNDKIAGVGDFNGDGKDEFVITSNWGIGIIKKNGSSFTSLVAKPKDTWFGSWRYNASVNSGKDKIAGIGDFNGDGKDDILITSSWGIGILKLYGSSLTSLVAKPNDTWFGAWRYNASVNSGKDKIAGIGDFDGNNKADVLVTSSWGIGILKLYGSSMTSMLAKPKDTWFGAWRYNASVNSGKDSIEGIGDFDNNGKDDILIKSSWGIGILKTYNTRRTGINLTTMVAKSSGTWFGSWNFNPNHNTIKGIGDFDGDGDDDIIIQSGWGIGLLKKWGSSFYTMDLNPYNHLFGSWIVSSNDMIKSIGDYDGDGSDEILFQRTNL